jgi:hypothetical protein
MKNKIAVFFFFILLIFPVFIFADTPLVPCEMGSCTLCDLFQLFVNLVLYLLAYIIPPVATIMFLYGGIVFYTSGGNPERTNKGKDIIKYAVIGIVIIYSAWIIVGAFLGAIGVAGWTGLGTWEVIDCSI